MVLGVLYRPYDIHTHMLSHTHIEHTHVKVDNVAKQRETRQVTKTDLILGFSGIDAFQVKRIKQQFSPEGRPIPERSRMKSVLVTSRVSLCFASLSTY